MARGVGALLLAGACAVALADTCAFVRNGAYVCAQYGRAAPAPAAAGGRPSARRGSAGPPRGTAVQ